MMGARRPNRRSSIYLGKDGLWHGWVTVGVKADGLLTGVTGRAEPKLR